MPDKPIPVLELETEGHNLQEAIKKAVVYCRNHDILKELLEENASEVLNMLMTEWNWDDALAVRFEEGQEKGIEIGEQKRNKDILELLKQGISMEELQRHLEQSEMSPQ